jgi:hypothetical protein
MNAWKCTRRFADAGMCEKQVHQHRLAAPHPAPKVETLLARGFCLAKTGQQTFALGRLELFAKLLEPE